LRAYVVRVCNSPAPARPLPAGTVAAAVVRSNDLREFVVEPGRSVTQHWSVFFEDGDKQDFTRTEFQLEWISAATPPPPLNPNCEPRQLVLSGYNPGTDEEPADVRQYDELLEGGVDEEESDSEGVEGDDDEEEAESDAEDGATGADGSGEHFVNDLSRKWETPLPLLSEIGNGAENLGTFLIQHLKMKSDSHGKVPTRQLTRASSTCTSLLIPQSFR
jgi:hypothetical protein